MRKSEFFLSLDAFLESLTPFGIMRAIRSRWHLVCGFLFAAAGVGWAICRYVEPIYEATATFTLSRAGTLSAEEQETGILGSAYQISYGELLNTRVRDWFSQPVVTRVLRSFRTLHSGEELQITDDEIVGLLSAAKVDLRPRSRCIEVTLRSSDPKLCAEIARLFVESIAEASEEANIRQTEELVAGMEETALRQRQRIDKLVSEGDNFRMVNLIDRMRLDRDMVASQHGGLIKNREALESKEAELSEAVRQLKIVDADPSAYASVSGGLKREKEIADAYLAVQKAELVCRDMLRGYTKYHPVVRNAGREVLRCRQKLRDATKRAWTAAETELREIRVRIADLRAREEEKAERLHELDQRLAIAGSGARRLDDELSAANRILEDVLVKQSKARVRFDLARETITPGVPPEIPKTPVAPNPMIVYAVCGCVGLLLGLLSAQIWYFCEDRIEGPEDLERRLGLKVLAALPHVSDERRSNVALQLRTSKASAFSEALASLSNFVVGASHGGSSRSYLFVSTQPGEGKTISATSLAISFASAGRKTLLVDFDLRRPQQASVWNIELTLGRSFSHVLSASTRATPDFASLVNPQGEGLPDVIASLPPDNVHPASIFGHSAIAAFFAWARVVYERIIIDAPPFGLVGDVVSLAGFADSVILVCRPARIRAATLNYCANELRNVGAHILGVVVNDVDLRPGEPFAPSRGVDRPESGYSALGQEDDRDHAFSDEA